VNVSWGNSGQSRKTPFQCPFQKWWIAVQAKVAAMSHPQAVCLYAEDCDERERRPEPQDAVLVSIPEMVDCGSGQGRSDVASAGGVSLRRGLRRARTPA